MRVKWGGVERRNTTIYILQKYIYIHMAQRNVEVKVKVAVPRVFWPARRLEDGGEVADLSDVAFDPRNGLSVVRVDGRAFDLGAFEHRQHSVPQQGLATRVSNGTGVHAPTGIQLPASRETQHGGGMPTTACAGWPGLCDARAT